MGYDAGLEKGCCDGRVCEFRYGMYMGPGSGMRGCTGMVRDFRADIIECQTIFTVLLLGVLGCFWITHFFLIRIKFLTHLTSIHDQNNRERREDAFKHII